MIAALAAALSAVVAAGALIYDIASDEPEPDGGSNSLDVSVSDVTVSERPASARVTAKGVTDPLPGNLGIYVMVRAPGGPWHVSKPVRPIASEWSGSLTTPNLKGYQTIAAVAPATSGINNPPEDRLARKGPEAAVSASDPVSGVIDRIE